MAANWWEAYPDAPAEAAPAASAGGNWWDDYPDADAAPAAAVAPAPAPAAQGGTLSIGNMLRGVGERTSSLVGGAMTTLGAVPQRLQERFPLPGIVFEGSMLPRVVSGAEYNRRQAMPGAAPDLSEILVGTGRAAQERDLGYEPGTTWEGVKEAEGIGDTVLEALKFGIEQGVVSLPDMAAVMTSLPAYMTARTGEVATDRTDLRGDEAITDADLAAAAGTAAISALMERFGAERVLGKLKGLDKDVLRRIMRAGAAESITEAGQSGIEHIGTRLGQEELELDAILDEMAAGAVGGGVAGAALRGAGEAGAAALGRAEPLPAFEEPKALPRAEPITVDAEGTATTAPQRRAVAARAEELGLGDDVVANLDRLEQRKQAAIAAKGPPPALPAPDPTLYVTPEGQAGRAGDIAALLEQARGQRAAMQAEREAMGLTPDVEANLERLEQRSQRQPLALPAPDDTIYVDTAGRAGTIGQQEALMRQANTEARAAADEAARMGFTSDVAHAAAQQAERDAVDVYPTAEGLDVTEGPEALAAFERASELIELLTNRRQGDRRGASPDRRQADSGALGDAFVEAAPLAAPSGRSGQPAPQGQQEPARGRGRRRRQPAGPVETTHLDFQGSAQNGQHIYQKTVNGPDGRPAAVLRYTLTTDDLQRPRVEWIETAEGARRQGYASALLDDLAREFGAGAVQWTLASDEGAALRAAFEERHGLSKPQAAAPKRSRKPDATQDSVLEYLAKSGGISMDEAIAQGIDRADFSIPRGFRRPFTRKGRSFDAAAELLDEAGYPVRNEQGAYDPNVLLDLISAELRGEPTYSSRNTRAAEEAARREEESREGAIEERALTDRRLPGQERTDAGPPRRRNLEERKRVAAMSREEMRRELLTSERTGLGNKRAYEEREEHERLPAVASVDVDGLGFVNDNYGHTSGDLLLDAIGRAMKAATPHAWHFSGDEFVIEAESQEALADVMEQIEERLALASIEVETETGERLIIEGIGLSYGRGDTYEQADRDLKRAKEERQAQGLRAPKGQKPLATTIRRAGGQDPEGDAPGRVGEPRAELVRLEDLRKNDAVEGRYMGVDFTGTVRSVREDSRGDIEVEIDFPAPLRGFRGRDFDVRSGLILGNLGEDDYIRRVPKERAEGVSEPGAASGRVEEPRPEYEERTPEQQRAIERYGLPEDTHFAQDGKGLVRGKWRAGAEGVDSNYHDTVDGAAKELAQFLDSTRAGRAERERRTGAEDVLERKLKAGEKPTFEEWRAAFPQLRPGHRYLRQPEISPFLIERFGFSRSRIRDRLGKAAGTLTSDSGAKYPIVYFDRLADVLKEDGPEDFQLREGDDVAERKGPKRTLNTQQQILPFGPDDARPGATAEQIKRANALLDDLRDLAEKDGDARTLAVAFNHEFRENHTAALIGKTIRSHADLATLAQVYRSPRYETLHYLFVNEKGRIVAETGVSSRLPGSANAWPTGETQRWVALMLRRIEQRSGKVSMWMLHNHPSGISTPSDSDIQITTLLAASLDRDIRHVVIDSNEYSFFEVNGKGVGGEAKSRIKLKEGEDPLLTPSKPHPVLGRMVWGPEDVVKIGKELERKAGWVTVVGVTTRHHVRSIGDVPETMLRHPDQLKKALKRFGVQNGSADLFLVGVPERNERRSLFEELFDEGYLLDATDARGMSLLGRYGKRARNIFARPPELGIPPGVAEVVAEGHEDDRRPSGDLFGDDVEERNKLEAEKRKRDAKRSPNRDVDADTGAPGDLFTRRKQLDIDDLVREVGGDPRVRRLVGRIRRLEQAVDAAYERDDARAEDLDAKLAELREELEGLVAELEESGAYDEDDQGDVEPDLRRAYAQHLAGRLSREDLIAQAKDIIQTGGGKTDGRTDEQLIEAARDAYEAERSRRARRKKDAEIDDVREPADPDTPQTESAAFKAWFAGSKVVDKNGKPLRVYHGTSRLDRFDAEHIRAERATSGPMPYFTASAEIASNYAKGKADTSLDEESYEDWFKFVDDAGTKRPIGELWRSMTAAERARFNEVMPRLRQNEDTGEVEDGGSEGGMAVAGTYETYLREKRGNGIRAAIDLWLASGALFDDEAVFLNVLKAAGVDMRRVDYQDFKHGAPGVLPVYLRIENPLVTSKIPRKVVRALERAADDAPAPEQYGADAWDKRTRDPEHWIAELKAGMKDGGNTGFVWTSVPDWVTKTLERLGYDGIHDVGGKMGGEEHDVWLPFHSRQVKSAVGNVGTFDPSTTSILREQRAKYGAARKRAKTPSQKGDRGYARIAQKAIDEWNARVGWRYGPLGKLPSKHGYLDERYRALGRVGASQEIARETYKALSEATPADQQAVYEYLTNRDVAPQAIENVEIRRAAVKAKRRIDDVGQRLVELGMLSSEAYETHAGEYLPRLYLKHLLGDQNFRALGNGKRLSDLGYLKRRQDIPEEVRRVVLGEITDPAFLASFGLGRTLRDIALVEFLEAIATRKEWAAPHSTIKWRGKPVSPFWLAKEAQALRRRARLYKPEDAAKAKALAERMEAAVDEALEALGTVDTSDYAQIPDSTRYGALRGLWVRKEIFDDLVGPQGFIPREASIAELLLGQGGLFTRATQAWKMSKVVLNPPAQVRNFVANMSLLHLSGVPFHRVYSGELVGRAVRSIARKDRYYQIAKKYGLFATTFAANEGARIRDEWVALQEAKAKGAARYSPQRLMSFAARLTNVASDVYGAMEAIGKIAKLIDAMEREGKSASAAMIEAHEALFDYSLVPRSVQYLRNQPLGAPFITFMYKALGAMAETAVKHPMRFAPYVGLAWALGEAIQHAYDVDDDDIEKLRKAFPAWMNERGHMLLWPFKDQLGRWQAIDVGYFVPWGPFADLAAAAREGKGGKEALNLVLFSGPLTDVTSALDTNVDPFTGREIVNPSDPPAQKLKAMMTYIWNLAMPGFLTETGAVKRYVDASKGRVDSRGELGATKTQAALRMFGVNVYPVDPEATRAQNLRFLRYELEDMQARARELLRNRNLTDREREEIRATWQKLMQAKQQEIAEYSEASEIHPNLRAGDRRAEAPEPEPLEPFEALQ